MNINNDENEEKFKKIVLYIMINKWITRSLLH